jgi:hypothetical protein
MTSDDRLAPKSEPEPVSESGTRIEHGDPPPVRQMRRHRFPRGARPWVVAGVVVVIVGSVLSWWATSDSSTDTDAHPTSPEHPSPVVPTWTAKLKVSRSGQVLGLPVLYPVINAVVPPGVRWEGPGATDPASVNADDQLNIWGEFNSSKARALRVEVVRYQSEDKARSTLSSDRSGCTGANKKPCAGYVPPKRNVYLSVFEADVGRAQTVSDLGDDSFAASVDQRKFKSPLAMEPTDTTYNIGGSVVECRFHNVVISVDWLGADYPADAAGKNPLTGKKLPYGETRQYAIKVVQAIIARLSHAK